MRLQRLKVEMTTAASATYNLECRDHSDAARAQQPRQVQPPVRPGVRTFHLGQATEEDFFTHRDDDVFWVEMTFGELTEQEKNTFKRYVRSNGTVCVRKTCRRKDGGLDTAYNGWVEQPDEAWLRGENAGDYGSRDKIAATPLKGFDCHQMAASPRPWWRRRSSSTSRPIRAELHFTEALEEGAFLGPEEHRRRYPPDFYLIPAIRDLTEEIKVKATTSFGRLLSRSIREMAERDQRFIQVKDQLKMLIASLNDRQAAVAGQPNELQVLEQGIEEELQSWGVKVNIEVTAPDIERVFELGTDLHLDDGIRTTANRKGHGLQRAVIFALLRSWAKALRAKPQEGEQEVAPRKQSESVIFAMEEPDFSPPPCSATPGGSPAGHRHDRRASGLSMYPLHSLRRPSPLSGSRHRQQGRSGER